MPEISPFRKEAVAYLRERSLGTILLARPVSHTVLVVTCAVALIAAGLFICSARITRRVTAMGILVPREGLLKISATQSGSITDVRVSEGASVQAGQILFTIGNGRSAQGTVSVEGTIGAFLNSRRESLLLEHDRVTAQALTHRASLSARMRELAGEQSQLEDEIALQ